MKYFILLAFSLLSFLNANYLVYEDKNNDKTIEYIKKNKSQIFKKTDKNSLGPTSSSVWLLIPLTNISDKDSLQYIRFREAFLYKLILYDNSEILKGGSIVPFEKRNLPYVTDTFEIFVPSNSSKLVYVEVIPKYNATYAYDIFISKDELVSHNNFFEYVFISYFSIMIIILISAIIILLMFKERLFAYYIYFIIISTILQIFQSGYILYFKDFSNIIKYDELLALGTIIGITLFLKTLFEEEMKKHTVFRYLIPSILIISFIGIVLLVIDFSFYIDLFVEVVILNYSLITLLIFVLFMVVKKVKYSLFALAGISVFIITSLACAFYYIGLVDNHYSLVIMQVGSIIEAFAFLALILYRIYNHILEQKKKSDNYALKLNEMQLLAKMGTWRYYVKENNFFIDKPTKEILELNGDIHSFENFMNLLYQEEISKVKGLRKKILSQQSINEYNLKIITASGKLKYISLHWKFYYNELKELTYIDGYILDITEKVSTQKELEKQHTLLLHQGRLAQQGEMLNMIAHQWRQPLTAISATINSLLMKNMIYKKIDTKELSNELTLVADYTQHLSYTIDDFRNFFKVEKRKTTTTLEELLEKSIRIVKTSMDSKEIELVKNYNGENQITSFSNEIQQVILNLLKNAEDVLVERKIKTKKIFIETKIFDNYAILTINDNAGGINEEFINKIFEPYFTTKINQDGTGLGLYMSKMIINEHCNGEINVKNNKQGAMFTIKLELDEAKELCS